VIAHARARAIIAHPNGVGLSLEDIRMSIIDSVILSGSFSWCGLRLRVSVGDPGAKHTEVPEVL
jgi:hypothetical protein